MTAPSTSALTDLLARVRAAAGPDREIDAEIWLLKPPKYFTLEDMQFAKEHGAAALLDRKQKEIGGASWRYLPEFGSGPKFGDPYFGVSPVTLSVDAAIALAERVLPGKLWKVEATETHRAQVSLSKADHRHSAALALLCAVLSALISKENEG